MSHYAVGDVQGCLRELQALLDRCAFDPAVDTVWLVGDLVNRGPDSAGVLRLVRSLGSSARTVLGNHDLHLLACAYIDRLAPKRRDTFHDILSAPDRDELLDWLRRQPLAIFDASLEFLAVHAGLLPGWNTEQCLERAREVETMLAGPDFEAFLDVMYGNEPAYWSEKLAGMDRLRVITNVFSRLRFCARDGRIDMRAKGNPDSVSKELVPWYKARGPWTDGPRIVFGHWSTLSLSPSEMEHYGVYPLDTGAVWGGRLSALRLEDRRFISVPSATAVPI